MWGWMTADWNISDHWTCIEINTHTHLVKASHFVSDIKLNGLRASSFLCLEGSARHLHRFSLTQSSNQESSLVSWPISAVESPLADWGHKSNARYCSQAQGHGVCDFKTLISPRKSYEHNDLLLCPKLWVGLLKGIFLTIYAPMACLAEEYCVTVLCLLPRLHVCTIMNSIPRFREKPFLCYLHIVF